MRRRYIFRDGAWMEIPRDYVPEPVGPLIVPDLPGYESPATGQWVEGRAQRREDLKRSGCRPWEGREQEVKEQQRQQAYLREINTRALDEAANRAFHQMDPRKRRLLERA